MAEELVQLLKAESRALQAVGDAALARDRPGVAAALTGLLASVATGVPVIGVLVDKVVSRALVSSVDAQLDIELEALRSQAERQRFVADIAETLEALLGQALIQIVRSQNHLAGEQKQLLTRELGGLRDDLAGFRASFGDELARASGGGETVRIALQEVEAGGIGVRVSNQTSKRVFIDRQRVSGGVGIDLT